MSTVLAAECRDALGLPGDESQPLVFAAEDDAGLAGFAATVLAEDAVSWWWSDVDRDAQVWIEDCPHSLAHPRHFELADEPQRWYDHAQHPSWDLSIDTSTALDALDEPALRCALGVELAGFAPSDWAPAYPLRTALVGVTERARVFEIHQPSDWHRLVVDYPAPAMDHRATALHTDTDAIDDIIDDGPAPNWPRVAAGWDGVHLSFYGLLTAYDHPVSAGSVTTTLSNWGTERTLWLRPAFSRVLDSEPITCQPRSKLHPLSHD